MLIGFNGDNSVHTKTTTILSIPAKELKIGSDERQRDYFRAKKISKEWDWDFCGVLECSPKDKGDGLYSIVDGRMRLKALGIKYPDLVYPDGTLVKVLVAIRDRSSNFLV